jgi:EmrB/QacA subfamily drug resistance transporter
LILQPPPPVSPDGAASAALGRTEEAHTAEPVVRPLELDGTESQLPRRRLIFCVCAISLFMTSVDQTIVATALPRIGTALHARVNWLGWTITIYALATIVMLPLYGRLGDRFGRKRVFVLGAVVFTVASVACGLANSIYLLVPLRLVQAVGGGAFMPSSSGIIADHFGPERDRALGMFASIFSVGGATGPVFGGLITQYWSWRGIFFFNLPIGVALVILIARYVPKTESRTSQKMDYLGIALLAFTIVTGMLAITTLGKAGVAPTSLSVLVPAVVSIALGYTFVRHLSRSEAPIIPMRLLRGKGFAKMNVLNVFMGACAFGWGVLVPLYARNRYRISLSSAGTVLSAQAIGMAVFAMAAAINLRRTGYRKPMAIGLSFAALSLVMLSLGPHGLSPYWWIAIGALMSGVGIGTAAPASNNATLSLAPNEVAAISGLRATFRQIGQILSISIATAVLARSTNPGLAQAHVYWVFALVLVVLAAVSFTVPERRDGW